MAILVKNRDKERLVQEIYDLKKENKPLFDLLTDLRDWVNKKFDQHITITHIYRLQVEQDKFYKDNERYKRRKFKSPHQFWHAIDIRSRDFTEDEIRSIENYLNTKYNKKNFYSWTARDHNIGLGDHFHIQYYKVLD